jgi:zinc protease
MEALINQSMAEFEKRGVSDEDVEKFKNKAEAQAIYALASVARKVSQLAAYQTFTGNPNKISEELAMYRLLTKEDVMKAYHQYIKNKNRVIVSVVTAGQEELKAGEDNYVITQSNYTPPQYGYEGLKYVKAKDNFERKKIPGNGANPVVKVPAFWRRSLSNGMRAIGTENTEIPTVTLSISLKGGRLLEATDVSTAGVTELFVRMMNEDTKNYTSEEFNAELEKLGSSITVNSTTDAIVFTVQTLKKHLDKTLKLLEERMLNPKFTPEDFSRIKSQLNESIINSRRQASIVANNVYAKVNYGQNHIFGLPENGTTETIKNVNLNNIQFYYDNFITSEDGRIVIVGDVKENDLLPKLAFLNKLPKKSVRIPTVPPAREVEKTKIYVVDVPRAAQTEFRLGKVTDLKYDATGEYYKAYLANYNLGAAFSSRLNLNLREDKGWTYGARSGFSGNKYTGTFTFSSGIRADATDSALYEVINEIRGYATAGIKEDEIEFMRKSIGQSDARNYETGLQKAAFIGRILEYNLPADYVAKQTQIRSAITRKEIDAVAKKYLDVDKMNIVLVGDKKKILLGLQKFGYEIVELDTEGNPVN